MCGIAGFIDFSRSGDRDGQTAAVNAMTTAISHRGPDDLGAWLDPDTGIALGHRRLSIIDLSREGSQPMVSPCGRYVIVYNGEIYNFQALRRTLDQEEGGFPWRGRSDTEVLLAAIARWGLEKALQSFIGMFAFALWDRAEKTLTLARDRIGEKPLYYGWMDNVFLFGSELKALMAHPRWRGSIDRDALTLFLQYNFIPVPHTIFQRVFKIEPGTFAILPGAQSSGHAPSSGPLPCRSYWDLRTVAEQGVTRPFPGNETEAVRHLDTLLRDAVSLQMVADVPLGAFLSGGTDSSTVVALMQSQSSRPVRTFTIGFDEPGYNEAERAKAVARRLGTDHTELYVTPKDALEVIPLLPTLYDEPFADASQIPTFLVSRMTRQHVTVSLSGDGGDELFGGYNRYLLTRNLWRRFGWIPPWCKITIRRLFQTFPASWIDRGLGWLGPEINRYGRAGKVSDKLRKFFSVWEAASPEALYDNLTSHWHQLESLVPGARVPSTRLTSLDDRPQLPDMLDRMMYLDQIGYLPEDILVKVDRAAMAVSLESRIPLLDHRIVEFAWTVPLALKFRQGEGKWLLRQVLNRYLPQDLIQGPKRGFAVPLGDWLKGPLRDWGETLLDEKRLKLEGFLNPEPVRTIWQEHRSGKYSWHYRLWDILMFQAWLEKFAAKIHS
ncbi:MAG: asparagine synthase (glutamine-hydrolyzing) [Deltaproteobacteria bacterium]|nr:asparagine synthase (glutamine-hydrolyzing) [Deltaproteobacteria bacterium]